MICEYSGNPEAVGPCEGEVKVRRAMTAYPYAGPKNTLDDPNRDFTACEAHFKDYADHWQEMWDEVNRDIREGIHMGMIEERLRRVEDRTLMEDEREAEGRKRDEDWY